MSAPLTITSGDTYSEYVKWPGGSGTFSVKDTSALGGGTIYLCETLESPDTVGKTWRRLTGKTISSATDNSQGFTLGAGRLLCLELDGATSPTDVNGAIHGDEEVYPEKTQVV